MTPTLAIVSMLHEPRERNSATRLFRGEPVLCWTLSRLCQAARLSNIAILCWEDQVRAVEPIAGDSSVDVLAKGPRRRLAAIDSVAAARRWTDGWRGGLLGACDFDLGFYAPWALELLEALRAESAVLVDPSSGLVDPALIDALIARADACPDAELIFSQAASGLGGALVRAPLLGRLTPIESHAGRLLHYLPDRPVPDPITSTACVPVATSVARCPRSLRLDSARQIDRISSAAASLNGDLRTSDSEALVGHIMRAPAIDSAPREIVLELNTTRRTSPIYWPGKHLPIQRPQLEPARVARILSELGRYEDSRLVLGGVGDPLESDVLFETIELARRSGIRAIMLQTDLLTEDKPRISRLAGTDLDVISVNVPAASAATYASVMGTDGYRRVIDNIAEFVRARQSHSRGVPLLVPVFAKCAQNLAEMEAWYDQWLRTLGCAVIDGPSDFAGQIPAHAVADMSPSKRAPCARLSSRLTVLC
ncbi:MAG: radical SAM protein, partial [Tepidisphaeraceae bacterium]